MNDWIFAGAIVLSVFGIGWFADRQMARDHEVQMLRCAGPAK